MYLYFFYEIYQEDKITGCFFLSDIFETLITPSILKISSFCKAVMTNQTGQFDDLVRKSAIYEKRNPQTHSKFTQYFACDHVFRESTVLDCH